jgi:hypothetical protein
MVRRHQRAPCGTPACEAGGHVARGAPAPGGTRPDGTTCAPSQHCRRAAAAAMWQASRRQERRTRGRPRRRS